MHVSLNTNKNHTQFKALKSVKFADIYLEKNKEAQKELLNFCNKSVVKQMFDKYDGNILFTVKRSQELDFPWRNFYKTCCSLEFDVDKLKFENLKSKYSKLVASLGLSNNLIEKIFFSESTKHYLGNNNGENIDCMSSVKNFIEVFEEIKNRKFNDLIKEHEIEEANNLELYEKNLKKVILND